LLAAWEAGTQRALGRSAGLAPKDRPALYEVVRVHARDDDGRPIPPGEARAAALERTIARYAKWRQRIALDKRHFRPLSPNALMAWLNEGVADREPPEERPSGTRKASEPQRAAFTLPDAPGAVGGEQ
jgi:hypothetical protein